MKRFSFFKSLIAGVLMLSLLPSCGGSSNDTDSLAGIDMLPVKVKGDLNYSLYKSEGTVMYRDQLPQLPSAVVDGVFSMGTPYGVALYSTENDDTPVMLCKGLASAGRPGDGVVPVVRPGGRIELLDLKGEPIATLLPYEGCEVIQSKDQFSEHRLGVQTDDLNWGYVDTKGMWVVNPVYFYCEPFSEGKAIVVKEKADGDGYTHSVIDRDGNELYALPEGIFTI